MGILKLFTDSLSAKAFTRLAGCVEDRQRKTAMSRCGGIQKCPWCNVWVQTCNDDWFFEAYPKDPSLDLLHCGNCRGTSLWLFGMGMHYMKRLDPPRPTAVGLLETHASC